MSVEVRTASRRASDISDHKPAGRSVLLGFSNCISDSRAHGSLVSLLNNQIEHQYQRTINQKPKQQCMCFERDAHIGVYLHRERLSGSQSQRHQLFHRRSLFTAVYGDNIYCAVKVRKTGECPTAGPMLPDLGSRP